MFWRRRQSDEDFGDEIRAHIELEVERLEGEGIRTQDAEAAARRAFGNVTTVRERFYETNRWMFFDHLRQDLGYGVRMLRHNPGFTATAVLSLALGIGANTAIFSLIDAALLRYLPVRAPQELVQFGGGSYSNYAYRTFVKSGREFSGILAIGDAKPRDVLIGDGASERVKINAVSGNYFELLGVEPAAGRLLSPMDDSPGAEPAAVISYSYWRDRFLLDPAAIGTTVRIGRGLFTVTGVAAKGFLGEEAGQAPDFWTPLNSEPLVSPGWDWLSSRNLNWLALVGRLRRGASSEQAGAQVTALKHRIDIERAGSALTPAFLKAVERESVEMIPASKGRSRIRQTFIQPLWILMAVAVLVLLIACANVANLLLARASVREREIGMRLALGAGRGRIMRQLLTESLLLATCGGVFGLGIAAITSRALLHLGSLEGALRVGPDRRMLGFTFALSALTGIVFGLAPAWRSARQDFTSALKGNRQGTLGAMAFRPTQMLVAAQVALSVVVLMCAGLLVQTLRNLHRIDTGMTPEHLLVVDIDPKSAGYTTHTYAAICERILNRLTVMPGVLSATFSENGLFTGRNMNGALRLEEKPPGTAMWDEAWRDRVGPRYFATLGISMLMGSDFTERDRAGSPPVVVINERSAKHLFPNTNPIGRKVTAGNESYRVIGVARDVRDNNLRGGINRSYYVPYFQSFDNDAFSVRFMVRTAAEPARLTALVRQAIGAEDKTLPIVSNATASDLIDRTIVQERLIATLSGWFAALALGLAAIGLYGLVAYRAQRRTGEIGIRMALGARRGSIVQMVLGECLALVLIGAVIGMPFAFAAGRALQNLLFGLTAADLPTIALSALGMVGVGIFAGWLPARRASRTEPITALRYE